MSDATVDEDKARERRDRDDYYDRKAAEHEFEDEKHQVYITGDSAFLQKVEEPTDWEGKLYNSWELQDEADNLPESPEQNWEEEL
jgi:hypothetical protein